jgi:hypothetical protein
VEGTLVYVSWLARHGLGVAALTLAGRGLILGIDLATPDEPPELPSAGRRRSERETDPNPLDLSQMASRPSLEDLKKLGGVGESSQSFDAKPELW